MYRKSLRNLNPVRLFRQVKLLSVFLHHARGAEARRECDHGAANHFDPFPGNAVRIAVVELRNDLLGERFVEVGAVPTVLFLDIRWVRIVTDRETVGAVVPFAPPTVENAEIQTAVTGSFLTAGAGGFEGAARIVEPNVAARNHLARDVDIVIFNENEVSFEFAKFAEMDDVLDEFFAFVVAGMRFAREDKLNGPLLVVDEADDIFELLENEGRTFVSGESARETDR